MKYLLTCSESWEARHCVQWWPGSQIKVPSQLLIEFRQMYSHLSVDFLICKVRPIHQSQSQSMQRLAQLVCDPLGGTHALLKTAGTATPSSCGRSLGPKCIHPSAASPVLTLDKTLPVWPTVWLKHGSLYCPFFCKILSWVPDGGINFVSPIKYDLRNSLEGTVYCVHKPHFCSFLLGTPRLLPPLSPFYWDVPSVLKKYFF